ncbi:hypothetical protein GCM10017673_30730 [Streptosporangium violaceochromogenes]|nr:hypothetical protein GCM10017673_30730 [Streptosporangium violaceochromogenes]
MTAPFGDDGISEKGGLYPDFAIYPFCDALSPTAANPRRPSPRPGALQAYRAAPDETTLIPQIRDITEMFCAMMGGLLERGWVPSETGGIASRMALLEDACPDR